MSPRKKKSEKRGKRPGILIVDDEKINIDILVSLLKPDFRTTAAKSGASALKRLEKTPPPDLILLDIMMPGMDGYEVCRRIKADDRTKSIPVIFLSALTEVENKTRGFEVGGVDYVTKPFQGKEVLARIDTHLRIRELHRGLIEENIRFKSLEEAAFEGLVIHEKGRILDANHEATRLLGCKSSALRGRSLMDFLPGERDVDVLTERDGSREGEIVSGKGEATPVEIRTRSMNLEGDPVSVTAIRDVTVQKKNLALRNENRVLKDGLGERYKFGNIIGRSAAMQSLYELIAKAAASDFHVLIYGESGTGKELAARTIHELSRRGKEAFVAVNCGAIPDDLFEREFFGHRKGSFTGADRDRPGFFDAAHEGVLFLDELGELRPGVQVKLLRVLESGEYIPVGGTKPRKADARIISATNRDLPSLVSRGEFREDLFYRIDVIEIPLPPLRERKEDIPLLVEYFLSRFSPAGTPPRPPAKVLDALHHYEWPGNVRQLENTLQRFLATGRLALPGDRPLTLEKETPRPDETKLHKAVENLERSMILDALGETKWHRGATADLLGIPRRTLQRKMAKYGFKKPGV